MADRNASIFEGLVAVVEYRGLVGNSPLNWRAMAAFDLRSLADDYCTDCAKDNSHWEYRVVDVPEDAEESYEEGYRNALL
jgi:hypothetical protein